MACHTHVTVNVNASAGGVSKSLTLTVFADPGAPGLSIVSGRLNGDLFNSPTDGPVATARFGDSLAVTADPAGNLYVTGACRTPSRLFGLTLRKISAAARFLTPTVIGLDSGENLYVADKDNTALRKINAAADVTTVSALTASLNAAPNSNTYRTAGTIICTTRQASTAWSPTSTRCRAC